MLKIDMTVCRGLHKRPGETVVKAAARALHSAPDPVTRKAASLLLRPGAGDPWARMKRAADLLSSV
jgi:hypothetical protein